MFDIGLNTNEFSVDEDLGIVFIDSLPSYEDLEEICKNLYRELYFEKFDKFQREFVDGFDLYINALATAEYVEKHGQDELISELVGTEGFISTVKDVIVRFSKWLAGMISKFLNWIMSLFAKTPEISNSSNPKQAAERACTILFRGSKSDRDKVVKEIKSTAQSVSTNLKAEGHKDLPGSNAHRTLRIPFNHQRILQILKVFSTDAERLNKKEIVSSTKLINKFLTELFQLLSESSFMEVSSYDAANYVLAVSTQIYYLRIDIMILYDKLKKIKPLKENSSEKECENYINQVKSVLNIDHDILDSDYSEKAKVFKEKVNSLFSIFKKIYTIEHRMIRSMKPTITALYGLSHYVDGAKKFDQLAGAIDVRVKIPADLMNRIRTAWRCKQMTINRLIISSSRVNLNHKYSFGASPYAKYEKLYTPKDIFIKYQSFKSAIWHKEWQKEYEEALKDMKVDAKKYYAHIEPDRVKNFLITIVHEARHIYQDIKNVHTKDLSRNRTYLSHKEYLELDHEMDARKAAANFEFKDSDVEWCKKLLQYCIEQETKELNKRWTFN